MNITDVLSIIGAFFSTIASMPQAWKVRKLHSTDDLHVYTVFLRLASSSIWTTYSILLDLKSLGIASIVVFILNILILSAIIRDRWWNPKITL